MVGGLLLGLLLTGCAQPPRNTLRPKSQIAEARLTPPKKAIVRPQSYLVAPGDTLESIASRFDLDPRQLAEWNNLSRPFLLRKSQSLRLFPQKPPLVPVISTADKRDQAHKNGKKNSKIPAISIDKDTNLKLYWQWPIKGSILKPYSDTNRKGIDIAAQKGQTVRSAEAGKVMYGGDGIVGYGHLLIIKHNDSYLSVYAHNDKLLVKEGEQVNAGQPIAKVGGEAPHSYLHFEIRQYGTPVNPVNYLPDN